MSTLKVNTIRHTGASSDAVTLASDGSCTVKATNNLSNRNLIINGAMNVAQRGSSSTTNGYGTVDRMKSAFRADSAEACTQEQVDVASGTTPYTLGFRKAVKQTNGNQTGGALGHSYAQIIYCIEAQDVASSGWNYTSTTSNITVSFWARASVAQTYTFHLETGDGTQQLYCHPYALSANTWTKITKTIPGNSNLQFDRNNGAGLYFINNQHLGTDYTTSGHTSNTWAAAGSFTDMAPDFATGWWLQNDATFEITGLQIEVGDIATDFEHRLYSDEYSRCERYFQKIDIRKTTGSSGYRYMYEENFILKTQMRNAPSLHDSSGYASDSGTFQTKCDGDYTTMTDGATLVGVSTTGIAVRGSSTNTFHYIRGRLHLAAEI